MQLIVLILLLFFSATLSQFPPSVVDTNYGKVQYPAYIATLLNNSNNVNTYVSEWTNNQDS